MLADSLPSPVSEEEEKETVHLIIKRKRSSLTSRARNSFAPQTSPNPTMAVASQGAALKSDFSPSPDEDGHLTIKKLKVQHSAQTPIQSSRPTQPATFTPEIINIEDSDEEQLQGLKTNIFNKFSSSST